MPHDDITPDVDFYQDDIIIDAITDLIAFRQKQPSIPIDQWDLTRAKREAMAYRALFLRTLALLNEARAASRER